MWYKLYLLYTCTIICLQYSHAIFDTNRAKQSLNTAVFFKPLSHKYVLGVINMFVYFYR